VSVPEGETGLLAWTADAPHPVRRAASADAAITPRICTLFIESFWDGMKIADLFVIVNLS
jgi:hypothetical protein